MGRNEQLSRRQFLGAAAGLFVSACTRSGEQQKKIIDSPLVSGTTEENIPTTDMFRDRVEEYLKTIPAEENPEQRPFENLLERQGKKVYLSRSDTNRGEVIEPTGLRVRKYPSTVHGDFPSVTWKTANQPIRWELEVLVFDTKKEIFEVWGVLETEQQLSFLRLSRSEPKGGVENYVRRFEK